MDLECYHDVPSFVLFIEAEVIYDGRASSTLARGNYLIIKKQDGSLLIHGANHVPALNYMSSGGTVQIQGDTITATRRSETIVIKVYALDQAILPQGWSSNKIQIRKTEAELTAQIVANPQKYLGPGSYTVHREYSTPAGPVDLVLTSTDVHVIEVKRKKITLKDYYQIQRYLEAVAKYAWIEKRARGEFLAQLGMDSNCQILGYLAGPDISANALSYCDVNDIKYLRVVWEEAFPAETL